MIHLVKVCLSICLDDNLKTTAAICFLFGGYINWKKVCTSLHVKIIFQRILCYELFRCEIQSPMTSNYQHHHHLLTVVVVQQSNDWNGNQKKQTQSIDSDVFNDVPQTLNGIADLLLTNSLMAHCNAWTTGLHTHQETAWPSSSDFVTPLSHSK